MDITGSQVTKGEPVMRPGLRVVVRGVVSAGLLAGSVWGASSASAASRPVPNIAVVFGAQHVRSVRGLVLVAGRDLMVYTFTGDTRGKPGTCTGSCAAVWPPVRGIPVLAHGVKIRGKFATINGQVTFNGWPLYRFTGEGPLRNHANGSFKVVTVRT
jgi:predicted lipoprotein with Yx(FWY)xxD motif